MVTLLVRTFHAAGGADGATEVLEEADIGDEPENALRDVFGEQD